MAEMKTEDLILALQKYGFTGIRVKGLDPEGRMYTIGQVRTEYAGGDSTVWLEVEEE